MYAPRGMSFESKRPQNTINTSRHLLKYLASLEEIVQNVLHNSVVSEKWK